MRGACDHRPWTREGGRLIAILDVAYGDHALSTACGTASGWADTTLRSLDVHRLPPAGAGYRAGRFFERELGPLRHAIAALARTPDVVVVDGYATLAGGAPGLGAHLHAALDAGCAVIGVAKSAMRGDDWSVPVLRGRSARPLRVTACGIAPEQAAACVASMHGPHRIPALLGEVDRAARAGLL